MGRHVLRMTQQGLLAGCFFFSKNTAFIHHHCSRQECTGHVRFAPLALDGRLFGLSLSSSVLCSHFITDPVTLNDAMTLTHEVSGRGNHNVSYSNGSRKISPSFLRRFWCGPCKKKKTNGRLDWVSILCAIVFPVSPSWR